MFLPFTGKGGGSYGEAKNFSFNRGQSLADIVIGGASAADIQGYVGHDDFEVVESTFIMRVSVC